MENNGQMRVNGAPSVNRGAGEASHHGKLKKKRTRIAIIAVGVLLPLAILLGGWLAYRSSTSAYIDNNKYQAVFLTNGQVYFGKLHQLNGGYFKLDDIYYLQTQTNSSSKNIQDSNQNNSDVQLIKLGNEIHGPNDEMIISKEQILFFENLKKDGKVTESIAKYQNQK